MKTFLPLPLTRTGRAPTAWAPTVWVLTAWALTAWALTACQQRSSDLAGQLLFTANGTFDAQADTRRREGQGLRSVEWRTKPPVPAANVRVVYDSDARPLAWQMTLKRPAFRPTDLKDSDPQAVNTAGGPGVLFRQGRLGGVLLVNSGEQEYTLLTHAYAEQQANAYLPAFNGRP